MKDDFYDLYKMSSSYIQGDIGEVLIAHELRNQCDMLVLRNLYLPVDNHYTEIDILGISKLGIFIIESKNYNGDIKGSINDKYWSVDYSFIRSEKLYNPILQNKIHKKAVYDILFTSDFIDIPIYIPVIFSDKSNLNIVGCEKFVFTLNDFIEAYNSVDKVIIDSSTVVDLFNYFKQYSNQSLDMRLLHIDLLGRSNKSDNSGSK